MKKSVVFVLSFILVIALSGCGGSNDDSIDLYTDNDSDGVPDELHNRLEEALASTTSGDPEAVEAEEASAYKDLIQDISDDISYSPEAKEAQQNIIDLTERLATETLTDEEIEEILAQLAEHEAVLDNDPSVRIILDAIEKMGSEASENLAAKMAVKTSAAPDWTKLQAGHIMWSLSPWSWLMPYVIHFSHAGNFDGTFVYDSMPSGGVRTRDLQSWKARDVKVAFGYNNKISLESAALGISDAESLYGTNSEKSYNFNFLDKTTLDRFYCSQLTWRIHKSESGMDLDSNNAWWFAQILLRNPLWLALGPWAAAAEALVLIPVVAPDEVYLSPYVTIVSEGVNP